MPTPRPPSSTSYRGRHWLVGTAISVTLVAVMASFAWDCGGELPDETTPPPSPSEARVEPAARPTSPPPLPTPAASAPAPAVPPSAPPVDPNAPIAPPSPADDHGGEEPPPELPQTVEWKLTKTTIATLALKKRIRRLEAEIAEAEAKGDQEGAQRRRVLMERSRQRVAELEEEAARLRDVVQSGDGGQVIPPPARGSTP